LATAAAKPERVEQVLVAAGPGPVHLLAPEHLEPDDEKALGMLAAGEVVGAVTLVTAEAQRDVDALRRLPMPELAQALAGVAPPGEHHFDTRQTPVTVRSASGPESECSPSSTRTRDGGGG
jgi:hypothetical protein